MSIDNILEFIQNDKPTKTISVAAGIIFKINNDNSVSYLLIQRAENDHWPLFWEFPRGKCDKSDLDIQSCLKREIKEETGLNIEIEKFVGEYFYYPKSDARRHCMVFLCKADPDVKIKLSHEHTDYKWVTTPGEVELLLNPDQKKMMYPVFQKSMQYVSNYQENRENLPYEDE